MWRTSLLARLGGWICLLGSVLALIAFFLPYWSSPPESLGQIFMSVSLYYSLPFLHLQQPAIVFGMIAVNAAVLVLLLPGNVLMVCGALLLDSGLGGSFPNYLKVPGLTLLCYLFISLLTFLIARQNANQVINEYALKDILTQLSIGAWLVPIGLLLALLGGILLWRGKMKASG